MTAREFVRPVATVNVARTSAPKPPHKTTGNGNCTSNFDRCCAYVAKMPPAISGSRGSDATFDVVRICRGFALDEDQALDILHEYNERCEPPWSECELIHKASYISKMRASEGFILDKSQPWEPQRQAARAAMPIPDDETISETRCNSADSWTVEFQEPDPEYCGGGPAEEYETKPRFAFASVGDLSIEPPKRKWFLADRRSKQKFLRMGKGFVLAADGGVGKSFFWLLLAASVVLNRALFDTFTVETTGHVALFMGEDDVEECQDRLYRICNALGLSKADREIVTTMVHICPLSGAEVALLQTDKLGHAGRTKVFVELIEFLKAEAKQGGFDWVFVGFDPLARFAGEAETSNSLATAFVEGLEAIIEQVPGQPALGCTHHSSQESVRAGNPNVRGATAIKNSFRAALTLQKARTESGIQGALLSVSKNNYAPEADPLWLVKTQDEQDPDGRFLRTGGVLRLATDGEAEELQAVIGSSKRATPAQRAEAKQTASKTDFEKKCETVLSVLPACPAYIDGQKLLGALRAKGGTWNHGNVTPVLAFLEVRGSVRDLSDGSKGNPRQWSRMENNDV